MEEKIIKLEAKGWKVGTVQEFLGLTDEESELIETRLALTRLLRERREKSELTQEALARSARTSQSRIAKAEANDPSVSIELILRALYAMGVKRKDIARALTA